ILEDVIREHPVLLNRAPTLHRLGIQAFEPTLVEGKAIRIHPLVCTAFNADFDGDQMAVHIPLSPESQVEASVLMLSSRNILSPAHGLPLAVPSQDMVLGIYYLTKSRTGAKGEGRVFGSPEEVLLALEAGEVELLTPIRLRFTGEVIDLTTAYDDQDVPHTVPVKMERQFIQTTVGRVIFNSHLPSNFPYVNGLLKKKGVQQLVYYAYLRFGLESTVALLDHLKELGFTYATKSGISIGIDDMLIPGDKPKLVDNAEKEVVKVIQQYLDGAITNGALQQGHRDLGRRHRKGGGRALQVAGAAGQGRRDQPRLRYGGLRRARIEAADSSAVRYSRFDGQAVGRSHPAAHHFPLPPRAQPA